MKMRIEIRKKLHRVESDWKLFGESDTLKDGEEIFHDIGNTFGQAMGEVFRSGLDFQAFEYRVVFQ